ncbi:hypothetical protein GLOIN_2v1707095 [Rhizophagus irregularis DAOM 181602=DAOM 197198]|uniref:Uncharacterized protein n=1 Tax=Rhizophagus irregularis (strain DAOM 181602 / DAOM 197198 / MUCL 43194) TaxID=747089 RepID=A0A2P4P6S8_RHIID|nr:hypothetical protein GLOIN_2v1707095 [Rhizophagus irregularis DAOM 181602=DAOM 197198]POG61090.1 hypothetical protein GLOIN_2v1707095 [Rhizophagus irregularis DAOM 181602=DAOM 197198]|eukprot:XP_025167956.1 hypothetical protein GLOIN_2v1707095 [Rhizophagus irregularis DAOM 181602=DAOM 197198]
MFQNKTDTLLFLLFIGILIFAEKIFDNHHAYSITKINSRDEILLSYLINSIFIISVLITCRILNTWCSIVLVTKKLSVKFQADWNILKMNHDSINLVEVLLHVIIFYIVCASVSDIDRRRYGWDNLFEKFYVNVRAKK